MAWALCDTVSSRVDGWFAVNRGRIAVGPNQLLLEIDQEIDDLAEWRWDGATSVRAETAQERTDRLAVELDNESQREIDAKALKAFAQALKDQFPSLDLVQLRTDFITRYKAL